MIKRLRYVFCGLFIASITAPVAFSATPAAQRTAMPTAARASGAPAAQRTKSATTRNARTITKRAVVTPNRTATTVNSISRAGNIISDAGNAIIHRAFGISRSAKPVAISRTATGTNTARSAARVGGASRARATAVFSDISKLGDGYNQCRDAYNTCMDQFCAGANETYRRCYCSNTFHDFRDREDALDAATTLLAQFENNNLNAVNLSAEEVNAMYTATAGEMAIKNDTSGAAELLSNIDDLLSGKKKASDTQNSLTSLSGLSVDFSTDLGDIWGTTSTSLFGDNSGADLSTMDGVELYNNAHKQCMQLVGETCDAGAVRNMAKSAYSILITQDCNAYQKKIDAKAEQVKSTVRTAEKYLREARLEEYRAHNSNDVNECMDKVEQAILHPMACGANYEKCMDPTGVYINSTTGEPIYSARLFKLNELIVLDGDISGDVLAQNPAFNKSLDDMRKHAESALDTCRTKAEAVWTEFKRNALIKISQAQDEKIEEVKMSCVSTMKDCYDTQSDALKSFDDTTAQASGALAARASRDMCSDKVLACAALYGDEDACQIDARTNKVTDKNGKKCGLTSLRNFVDTVDEVRIAEGCGTAVENYLKQICTPSTGTEGYPWNCRLRAFGNLTTGATWTKTSPSNNMTLAQMVVNYAIENCVGSNATSLSASESRIQADIVQQFSNLQEELDDMLAQKCEDVGGVWFDADARNNGEKTLTAFYSNVYGRGSDNSLSNSLGRCVENTTMVKCLAYNTDDKTYASYDSNTDTCQFTDDWYGMKCQSINGVWESPVCYVKR
ncbi:MAG: hypothetical protein ACLRFM_02275 [Alphaproteobacteria bacterium]